jgi:hypothetical protein
VDADLSLGYSTALGDLAVDLAVDLGGQRWTPRPLPPMPRAAAVVYHALTSLLVVMATGAAYVAALLVGFTAEACSLDAVAGTATVRAELAVIGLAWAAVPMGAGLVARRYRMSGRGWFGLAAAMTAIAIGVAALVDPSLLCR